MTDRFRTIACLTVVMCVGLASPGAAQEFDLEPLAASAVFPADGLPGSWAEYRTFLETPEARAAEIAVLREHLYAMISADARARVARGESAYPHGGDSTLAEQFEWAALMGLPGAAQVAASLRHTSADADQLMDTPGFDIRFDSVYTLVARDDGWAVRFPHYFMIGHVVRQAMANDVESSIAVLSTLFAAHTPHPADQLGASQATVMIMSAAADAAEMTAFWLAQFGLSVDDAVEVPDPSALSAYRGRDEGSRMSMELAVFAPPGRVILVAYLGVDGTYEANRPHYLNLLRTLRVRPAE